MIESPIADRIREQWQGLTKSDRMVARRLLADFPLAGLKTLAELAQRAGVSAPSVIRCIKKLGFQSYPDFQHALHDEVQATFDRVPARARSDSKSETETGFAHSVSKTMSFAQQAEINQLAELIASSQSSVLCLGGRVSQAIAMIFQAHLLRLRHKVELVSPNPMERAERLMDVGKNDVVVVFDYAPYDSQAKSFAQFAVERKASVVCFTDFNQSPVVEAAQIVICAQSEGMRGVPSLTAALGAAEAVVARVSDLIGARARERQQSLVGPVISFDLLPTENT